MDEHITLKNNQIKECVCEIRFSLYQDMEISAVLANKVQKSDMFRNYILKSQPTRNLPLDFIRSNHIMKYAPLYKLEGDEYSIGFGYNCVFIDKKGYYDSFKEFKCTIGKVLELLSSDQELNLIKISELRLKYLNLFQDTTLYDATRLELKYNDAEIDKNTKITLKIEKKENSDSEINITLINKASVQNRETNENILASVIDFDAVKDLSQFNIQSFFDNEIINALDELHGTIHSEFCGLINDDYASKQLRGC